MKTKKTFIFAGLSILIAVVLGAMGAHYLKETLAYPLVKIESWKTAVQYQLFHGLALLILILIQLYFKELVLNRAILFIKIGMTLFAGSIYLLTLNYSLQIEILPKILGPMTPIGGLFMILGWGSFVLSVIKVDLKNE